MNILITGVTGFVGSHLAELLNSLETPSNIFGLYRHQNSLPGPLKKSRINLKPCDITSPSEIARILQETRPDIIFNLAGMAHVMRAESDRLGALEINTLAIHHLIEECRKHTPKARLVLISSCEVYGKVKPNETPLIEEQSLEPHNFYGASKAAMEMIAKAAIAVSKLDVIVLRPFNHIGPRQSDRFVVSDFSRQIARMKVGKQKPILKVGDLSAQRDFTDVRDIAKAYWLAATHGKSGAIYNICSGKAYPVGVIATKLIQISGQKVEIVQDETRLRKSDIPILLGNAKKFQEDTDWFPTYDLNTTLRDTLQYWLGVEKELCLDIHAISK